MANARTYAVPAHHASPLGTSVVCPATHRGFNIQLWGQLWGSSCAGCRVEQPPLIDEWASQLSRLTVCPLMEEGNTADGLWGCFLYIYTDVAGVSCTFALMCCVYSNRRVVWHSLSDWHSLHHLLSLESYLGRMTLIPLSPRIWGVRSSCKGALCKNLRKNVKSFLSVMRA